MKNKIDNKVLMTGIIVVGILAAIFLAGKYYGGYSPQNTITANGISSVKVLPDLVSIYIGIDTKGTTSSEANNKNSEIYSKVKSDLMNLGFDEKEIQTQGFNIYPTYDYTSGSGKITGYQASHSLRIQVSSDNVEMIGKVVDAGANAGAGISSINFELSIEKQNEIKAQAIKLAAEDAKLKAQSLAEGVGKKLGSLVSVSSSDFNYNPWIFYSADSGSSAGAKEAAMQITPSEQEVTASVSAVFRIR